MSPYNMGYAEENVSNNKNVYECKSCNYICYKKFLFNQHCKTKKHLMSINEHYMPEHKCEHCEKRFSHIQSLNRHKKLNGIKCSQKKAKNKITDNNDVNIQDLTNMINSLMKQNENMILENKEMRNMIKDIIPKIGNTTINNKFNLQVFLNEECKDAINFNDFVETLRLEISDLDKTRQNGYITGISNIFIKGLKQLELHKRPIHCIDLKREILYVKDNNIWERDNENILKNAITNIAKKQIDKIKEWENKNPNWNNSEDGRQKYIDMVKNVTDINNNNNNNEKIIKSIAKEVTIEK